LTIFFNQTWKFRDKTGLRKWVYEKFEERVHSWEFNAEELLSLPVLPVIHGTQLGTAWSISSTGFAALSATDAGFFGKGIYFTSSCKYALPYTQFGSQPCLLISLINPGNVYPVIEHHKSDYSLMGTAITPGYNSHYICTSKDGSCVTKEENSNYDEFVIEQEAQIIPIAIIELDPTSSKKWQTKMSREIALDNSNKISRENDNFNENL